MEGDASVSEPVIVPVTGKKNATLAPSSMLVMDEDVPLAREIQIGALELDSAQNSAKEGTDGPAIANAGFSSWIKSPKGIKRQFRLMNVRFPYAIRPASIPKGVFVDPVTKLIADGAYKAWDKMQLCVEVPLAQEGIVCEGHADDVAALEALGDHFGSIIYEKKAKIFGHTHKDIKRVEDVMARFRTRFIRPETTKESGAIVPPTLYVKVPGYGDLVKDVKIYKDADSGNARVTSCSYEPRLLGSGPGAKVKATVFALRMRSEDGKLLAAVRTVPLRKDGSLDGDSPIVCDDLGRKVYRKVGPQDLTPNSVGNVTIDPFGLHFSTNISTKMNVTYVEFDREAPKEGASSDAADVGDVPDMTDEQADFFIAQCDARRKQRESEDVAEAGAESLAGTKRGRDEDAV